MITTYPLKFFSRLVPQEIVAPEGTVLDASGSGALLIIPTCSCDEDEDSILFETKHVEDSHFVRYRCLSCGYRTSWLEDPTKLRAIEEWTDSND